MTTDLIPIVDPNGEPCVANLGDLPPGRYVARLAVLEHGDEIVTHERSFARLGRDQSMALRGAGALG